MKKRLLFSILGLGLALTLSTNNVNAAETDSTLVAPALSAEPVIDGTIDAAWDAIPYSQMHNKLLDASTSEADYSVKFKVGWKGAKIFVLIDVTDNKIVISPDYALYKQDYTMIFMDLIKDLPNYSDENSFYYRTNADGSMVDGRYFNNWSAPEEGVVSASKARTGGFVTEYSVDVTKFTLTGLKGGEVIGFDIETGDNDDPAVAQRSSQYVWSTSSTGNDWASPIGEVGYITLGAGAPIIVAETDSTMMAPGLSAAPVIDGTIDAVWNAIPYTEMHNKLTDGSVSEADYSVKFKMGWKDTNIFVLVDVTDNKVVINPSFAIYKQDYTMIYMDLIKDLPDYSDENSFWYRINADASMVDGRYFNNWSPPEEGVTAVSKAKAGGFIAEYAVDVTKFTLNSLSPGQVIGFNLETGDNDDAAVAQRTSQYVWSKTSTGNDWATPLGEVGYVTLGDMKTAIKSISSDATRIYPNPANSVIHVSTFSSKVEIYNIAGSKVRTITNISANAPISIDGFRGIYFVKATAENGAVTTQKLIVQ